MAAPPGSTMANRRRAGTASPGRRAALRRHGAPGLPELEVAALLLAARRGDPGQRRIDRAVEAVGGQGREECLAGVAVAVEVVGDLSRARRVEAPRAEAAIG